MPQLNCKQCHNRKLRCDKQNPCSACRRAGIQCDLVQRARLPRGRSGKTKGTAALESRVVRLEALIHRYSSRSPLGPGSDDNIPTAHAGTPSRVTENGKLGEFIASDFWGALSQEVAGLRETLEDSDGDQADDAFRHDQPHVRPHSGKYSHEDCDMLLALDEGQDPFPCVEPDAGSFTW